MAKEIYYTVNDELKQKGNGILYYFCHHYLVVCYFCTGNVCILLEVFSKYKLNRM